MNIDAAQHNHAGINILFISRSYPPTIGGIEKQNYEIGHALNRICRTTVVANRHGKWALPVFIPYVILKTIFTARKYDVILLGDGALSVIGYFLKLFSRKPVACIVHGLDVTYSNRIYKKFWVGLFMHRIDRFIAVGNETINQGKNRGLPASKFTFIPNGTSTSESITQYTRHDLEKFTGEKIHGPILLTLGRLVKRKGIAWFIENVLRKLDEDIIYIIAGEGKEKDHILEIIRKYSLQKRVFLVGRVTETEKEMLYRTADLFIQPNIQVAGDMEGFGLVVLEAAAHGLVVIAARLEGLIDAIHHGENGYLVREQDADEYLQYIKTVLDDPEKQKAFGLQAREYVIKHFSWDASARKYSAVLAELTHAAP